MFLFRLFSLMCSAPSSKNFIKHGNMPTCSTCKFFIRYANGGVENSEFARCKLFGEKDLVSGVIKHKFASFCREDTLLCGPTGRYFEPSASKPDDFHYPDSFWQ